MPNSRMVADDEDNDGHEPFEEQEFEFLGWWNIKWIKSCNLMSHPQLLQFETFMLALVVNNSRATGARR